MTAFYIGQHEIDDEAAFRRLPQADNAVYRKAWWTLSHQSRHT